MLSKKWIWKNKNFFGHFYDPNTHKIILKFSANFSSKKRSQKTEPDLTSKSDITNLIMTKRKFMSLLSSQYDPMGLASVFLAKYNYGQGTSARKHTSQTPGCFLILDFSQKELFFTVF